MANRKLTCVSYIIMPDGKTKLLEELTDEERAQWQKNMRGRLRETISDYYTQHPDEYRRLGTRN